MTNGCKHNKDWIVTFCLLLLLLPAGVKAAAGDSLRTSAQSDQPRFDYRHIELENGLDVITLEDFSCPIVTVQLWYHVGSKNERPDRQGFAHMFEHMMFRGTDTLGPTDHFRLVRKVGGTTNAYTGFDRTVYFETLPASQLELALWLEAERMGFLKIDQEAFDTERRVVEEERRVQLNQPYGTLLEKILAELFKVHPYRWPPIGKISHLRAASVQGLRDFWTRYYVPNNAVLIIVGAVKHKEAQEMARKYFGWIPRYPDPPDVTVREPEPHGPRTVTVKLDNAPAPGAGVVFRTVPLRHKDTVPLDLLASVLGGGDSSRLYRELVAEKQIAVQTQTIHWSLEQDGAFGAGALMPPTGSDPNKVLALINEQIERLRDELVTERELTKAKNQALRSLVTSNLKIQSKARTLGTAAIDYGDVSYVNRAMDDINRVTREDIRRVAAKYLAPSRALIVKVKRNLLGAIAGQANQEQAAPVTGKVEKNPPKPGRSGLVRPDSYPRKAPLAEISGTRITPRYSKKTLPNGLEVLVVPNNEVPFVTVRLGLLAGAWTETKAGTASMAMQMLTKGTTDYTEARLADELETYAISLSGSGGMDTSSVNMSCLSGHIERGMRLLGEVTLRPTFPPEEFEKLRKQVRTSLAVSSATAEYAADREFRRRLYGKHPYSRTAAGEVKDVDALMVDDLKQWYRKYARPDMAVLILAGDVEEEKAFAIAARIFGDWKAEAPKPTLQLPPINPVKKTHIYLVDRPGSVQSQIRAGQLGITRHDDGYFVSRLVSNYFGWGFDSRLNKSIRVAKGLTYSVWGSYIANRFAGEFEVSTFSKTESTAEAVRAVIEEIRCLKEEGPTDQELTSSQSYMLGSFVMGRETPQQVARDLWLIESQQLGTDYLDRLLDGIAKADKRDCEKLVQTTIDPERLVIVVVGQADKLKNDLEQIAPVTVVHPENGPDDDRN